MSTSPFDRAGSAPFAQLDMSADQTFLLDNAPAVLAVLRAAWLHEQGLAQLDPAAEGDDEEHFVNALEHADDTADALATAVAALGEPPS